MGESLKKVRNEFLMPVRGGRVQLKPEGLGGIGTS